MVGRVDAANLERLAPERVTKGATGARERHTVLGPLRAGETRLDRREVEFNVIGVNRFDGGTVVPDALGPGVRLDELELFESTAGERRLFDRDLDERKERTGGAVLGRQVADRGAVLERDRLYAR